MVQLVTTSQAAIDYQPQAHRGLLRWYAALGKRTTEPADILWIGDSMPSGQGSSSWAQTYPAVALDRIRREMPTPGVTGGIGYLGSVPSVYQGTPVGTFPDCPVAINGVPSQYRLALAGNGLDASTVILTQSTDYVEWTFTGDGFDLLLGIINAAGGATITVDGTPYTWNGAGGPPPNLIQNATPITFYAGDAANSWYGLRGLTVGSHKVRLTQASGQVTACGLFAYNGDATKGIRNVRATVSGQGTASFYGGYASNWMTLNIGKMYFPDLVIIDLGNDDHTGTTASHRDAATYKANLQGIVSTIKSGIANRTDGGEKYIPSFLFTVMHGPDPVVGSVVGGVTVTESWPTYQQAMYDIAATDPDGAIEVLDMGRRLTSDGIVPYPFTQNYQGLLYDPDKIHFSDAGSDWAGNLIGRYLQPE